MRRLSWRSVPSTNSPPAASTSSRSAATSAADALDLAVLLGPVLQLDDSSSSMRNSTLPPSWMSVPRPAMLVAMVTAPSRPACATMCASCSWKRALSTLCVDAFLVEVLGEQLGLLDRHGADQHRLAASCSPRGSPWRSPGTCRRCSCRTRLPRRSAAPARWSGSRRRSACRCPRTRPPRSPRCRSCRASLGYMRK